MTFFGGDDATGTGENPFPDARAYPAYTTVGAVRAELPPRLRGSDVTEDHLEFAIDTQANRIDGELIRYYRLPAPPLAPPGHRPREGETAYMPAELERINRFYAVAEIIVGLLDLRGEDKRPRDWWTEQADLAMERLKKGDVILSYPFKHPDARPYFVPLAPGSPLFSRHPLSARRRIRYAYPEHRFAEGANAGRRRR